MAWNDEILAPRSLENPTVQMARPSRNINDHGIVLCRSWRHGGVEGGDECRLIIGIATASARTSVIRKRHMEPTAATAISPSAIHCNRIGGDHNGLSGD